MRPVLSTASWIEKESGDESPHSKGSVRTMHAEQNRYSDAKVASSDEALSEFGIKSIL
jgi:hypothetical protein